MNHLQRTRQAADELDGHLTDLMDLAGVRDGSDTDLKAQRAMAGINEVLEEVPRCGRTAHQIFHHGPLIYVDTEKDMRDWNTSDGRTAAELSPLDKVPRGRRAAVLARARRVTARGMVSSRRVISSNTYLMALDEALVDDSEPRVTELVETA